MATVAMALQKPPRRVVNSPAAGRASFPEIYFVKQVDNSRLVREVDRKKRRECYRLLGLGILVFLSGLLLSWQHLQCVQAGYEIVQLKTQRAALEEQQHRLRLEAAALTDPQRIDKLVRNLGMISPRPQQVIHLEDAEATSPPQPETVELARNFSASAKDISGRP